METFRRMQYGTINFVFLAVKTTKLTTIVLSCPWSAGLLGKQSTKYVRSCFSSFFYSLVQNNVAMNDVLDIDNVMRTHAS